MIVFKWKFISTHDETAQICQKITKKKKTWSVRINANPLWKTKLNVNMFWRSFDSLFWQLFKWVNEVAERKREGGRKIEWERVNTAVTCIAAVCLLRIRLVELVELDILRTLYDRLCKFMWIFGSIFFGN